MAGGGIGVGGSTITAANGNARSQLLRSQHSFVDSEISGPLMMSNFDEAAMKS